MEKERNGELKKRRKGGKHAPRSRFCILTMVILITLGFWSCSRGSDSGKLETLTVAMVRTELNALFYVAEAQKLFAANGLQVTFREDYDSGASAAAGMLNGEANIALAAEFPIVRQVFNKKDIASFGTIAKYDEFVKSQKPKKMPC